MSDKQPLLLGKDDDDEEEQQDQEQQSRPQQQQSYGATADASLNDDGDGQEGDNSNKTKNEDDNSKTASGNDKPAEDIENKKLTPEQRAQYRIYYSAVTLLCHVALVAVWAVFLGTGRASIDFKYESTRTVFANSTTGGKNDNDNGNHSGNGTAPESWTETKNVYNLQFVLGDLFIVEAIRLVLCLTFSLLVGIGGTANSKFVPAHDYVWHVHCVLWILVTAKAWGFGNWHTTQAVLVALCVATSTVTLYAHDRIASLDLPPDVMVRWESVKKILGPYLYPAGGSNKAIIGVMWFFILISKGAQLLAPLTLGQAVEELQKFNTAGAGLQLVYYGLLQVSPQLFESLVDAMSSYTFQTSYVQVAELTFSHVINLDVEWHNSKRLGSVMRYLDRGQQGAETLTQYLLQWAAPNFASSLVAFGIFIVKFEIAELASICFLCFAVYCHITILIQKIRRRLREKQNEADDATHDTSADALINIEVVKAYGAEQYEVNRYLERVKSYQRNNFLSMSVIGVINFSQSTIINTCTVLALFVVGVAAVHTSQSTGKPVELSTFVAITQYLVNLFTPLSFLGSLWSMMITNLTNLQRLADVLDQQRTIVDKPNAKVLQDIVPPLKITTSSAGAGSTVTGGLSVEFDNVSFHYPTQPAEKGIHNISFKVPAGGSLAFCGQTGAGKSSITRLLQRFYDVQSGRVLIGGVDIRDVTQKSLRDDLAIIPQDCVLFNTTIRENVLYSNVDASEEELEEASRKAQLDPMIKRFDKGWDTVVGERGLKLSGGEKQRVAIARCLLKKQKPRVLLLDEWSAALDLVTERQVKKSLDELSAGSNRPTTITVAHRLSTIQHCDEIIVMHLGRIAERGTHDQLMALQGKYWDMWQSQKKQQIEEEEQHAKVNSKKKSKNKQPQQNDEAAAAAVAATDE